MPSLFPGMDPYLEDPAIWPDFHQRFITYCSEVLGGQLPDNYEARIDEQIRLVEVPPGKAKGIRPDISILQREEPPRIAPATTTAATLEPVAIPLGITEEVRETEIRILYRPDRSLITVIELLSPTNKSDSGYPDYLAKRQAILRQPVHLVEINLLVGGRRPFLGRDSPPGDYYISVVGTERRGYANIYSWPVRGPLPIIPIPLKAPDPDLLLNLADVFAITYDRGRYARALAYGKPPTAPLRSEDVSWATELVRISMT